jgi:outer membrane lipoprotein-sorting protein
LDSLFPTTLHHNESIVLEKQLILKDRFMHTISCVGGIMNRRLLPVAASALVGTFFAVHSGAQNPSPSVSPVTPVSSVTKVDPSPTVLPNTKDLLEKFETVSGGHAVWSGFTTRYLKGIYQTEDASGFAAIEIFSKAPNKTLYKITLSNGVAIRQVCDGKNAWIEDPSGGMHEITGAALESRIRQSNFNDRADALLLAVTGHVLGTEKVGMHTAYVVEFTPQKKLTSKIYFDTESGFPVRTDDTLHREDGDYRVENYMEDYRAVDGAYFAFRLRHVEKGNVFTLRLTQIKNNVPVDDSMFLKPASAPK